MSVEAHMTALISIAGVALLSDRSGVRSDQTPTQNPEVIWQHHLGV